MHAVDTALAVVIGFALYRVHSVASYCWIPPAFGTHRASPSALHRAPGVLHAGAPS